MKIPQAKIDNGIYWGRPMQLVDGCTKVDSTCKNCWSESAANMRQHQTNPKMREKYKGLTTNGKWNGKIRLRHDNLDLPLRTRKPTVFSIWNDLFHPDVPFEFVNEVMTIISMWSQHTYLILTKRINRALEFTQWLAGCDDISIAEWPRNVWPGTTIGAQEQANERLPILSQIPAAHRLISVEPMLEGMVIETKGIDQVILGCETGAKRRPCKIEWMIDLVYQCQAAGVPVFVKQVPINGKPSKNMAEWPKELRVRELAWNK